VLARRTGSSPLRRQIGASAYQGWCSCLAWAGPEALERASGSDVVIGSLNIISRSECGTEALRRVFNASQANVYRTV